MANGTHRRLQQREQREHREIRTSRSRFPYIVIIFPIRIDVSELLSACLNIRKICNSLERLDMVNARNYRFHATVNTS